MKDTEDVLRARLRWVTAYLKTRNAALTYRRCGISPPTLRKWVRRYQAEGEAGLHSQSRRPHNIWKILDRHGWKRLKRTKKPRKPKSYENYRRRFIS